MIGLCIVLVERVGFYIKGSVLRISVLSLWF